MTVLNEAVVSKVATPSCDAVQLYQTEVLLDDDPEKCTGSPGSAVAPSLLPVTTPEFPLSSCAVAKSSLAIIRQPRTKFPRAEVELLPTPMKYVPPDCARKFRRFPMPAVTRARFDRLLP